MDIDDKLQKYLQLRRFFHTEGENGVRKLETMIREVCGYRDFHDFLVDNPGACEAIMNFVQEWLPRNDEWEANMDEIIESETDPS